MAGYWIPWEIGLTRKREVCVVARMLGVSRREAAAMCMEVWEWAQGQSVDGLIIGLTPASVSDAVGIDGIGEAMASQGCGWIVESESGIQFPNWDRFNGRPAKARLLAAERKRRYDASRKVTRIALHR